MRWLRIATTLAFLFVVRDAFADDAVKRADQLFREAKSLTDSGEYPPACPKLEESERLDPALGTEFNLADCYEHTERPAQAFKLFRAVAEAAHVAGKDVREKAARARADALESQIGIMRLKFATGSPPPDARITLDGADLQDFAANQFLSPGHHQLAIAGAKLTPWSRDVVVAARANLEVVVPDLVVRVASPPPPPPRETTTPGSNRGRIVAYALGGGAIVGLGVGLVAGEIAIADHDSAHSVCAVPNPCNDARAANAWTRATTAGNVSTIGFVSGGVLGAAAVVVWILYPPTASTRVSSTCGPQGCALGVRF